MIEWHKDIGVFWFWIDGYGLRVIDRTIYPPLFSERNGLIKVLRIGQWSIRRLTS